MRNVKPINDILMFFLEVAVYVAVGVWGWRQGVSAWLGALIAAGCIGLFALSWGVFAAPRARCPLHGIPRAAFEIVWFGLGIIAVKMLGYSYLAAVFALLIGLNMAIRQPHRIPDSCGPED